VRILHVVTVVDDQVGGGGPLSIALGQCAELRRRGHDAQVLGGWRGAGEPPTRLDGVPAHLFKVGGRSGSPAARRFSTRLSSWVRRHAPTFDLVHVHLSREAVPLLTASLVDRAGVPFVIQTHGRLCPPDGGWARLADHALTVPALRTASHRLAVDPIERDIVARLSGSSQGISLLPDGVRLTEASDTSAVAGVAAPEAAASEGRSRPLDIVSVGRLHPDKEVLTFAKAAIAALELGLDATFTVIGPDAGDLAALRELIATETHLDGRVWYEGVLPHPELLRRVARADLFVLPAADGTRSVALLEALAAGVACICTTGTRHALTLRARQGAMVTRPNEFALAQAIVRLADDDDQRAALAARGREVAAQVFDIAAVVDQLESRYGQALRTRYPQEGAPPFGVPAPALALDDAPRVIDLDALRRPLPDPLSDVAPLEGTDRLLWITTAVTPHRLALWRELAKLSDLTVALLAGSRENNRLVLDSAAEPFHVTHLRAPSQTPAPAVGSAAVRLYRPTRALRNLIRRRPDAVVLDGWESPAFAAAARWARRDHIPVVASYRIAGGEAAGEPASGTPGPDRAQGRLMRRADAVLAAGDDSVEAVLGMGVARERVALAPGLEETRHVGDAGRTSLVDVREGHRFTFLGPLIPRTNADGLMRAFHLARGLDDVLTIAGDGPMWSELVQLADELGVRDTVVFIPELDEVLRHQVLADAHTVVVPSTDEIWAGVVAEALENGRHVVVSTACSIAGSLHARPEVFVAEPVPSGLARAMMSSRQRWTIERARQVSGTPLSIGRSDLPQLARAGVELRL